MKNNDKIPYTEYMEKLYEASADRNPDTVWYEKITEFCKQTSRNNLRIKWRGLGPDEISGKLVRLLANNCPFRDEGLFLGYLSKKLPWTDWVKGLDDEFGLGGTLTKDMFRDGLWKYMKTNRQASAKEDEKHIQAMRTGGRRGRPALEVKGRELVSVASSFKEMYDILTDPASDKTFGRKYVTRSIEGRRGRHRKDQTFIRLDMRTLPVIMVRGKRPFTETDSNMNDCYALVGMERPAGAMSKTRWISSLKKIFKDAVTADGNAVEYLGITPCSLEYWMDQIARRFHSDTSELGAATARGNYFEKTTTLDLREDGSYRFHVDGMEDDPDWSPDPMRDGRKVVLIKDEYSDGANESEKTYYRCSVNEASDDPLRDRLLTRMGVISDDEDDEDEEEVDDYTVQRISGHMDFEKFMRTLMRAMREADVDPYDVQEELDSYGDYGDLKRAYDSGELHNYNAMERQFAKALPDSADKEAILLDLWNEADNLMEEVIKRSRRRMAESVRPVGISRRGRRVNETLNYSSFIPEVQRELDGLVASLKDAKARTERLMYGYEVTEDDYNELKEIHSAVCKSLDKLPW